MIYEQRTKGGKLACRDADLEKNKKPSNTNSMKNSFF